MTPNDTITPEEMETAIPHTAVAFARAWLGIGGQRITRAQATEFIRVLSEAETPGAEYHAMQGREYWADHLRYAVAVLGEVPALDGLADQWLDWIGPAVHPVGGVLRPRMDGAGRLRW